MQGIFREWKILGKGLKMVKLRGMSCERGIIFLVWKKNKADFEKRL